MSRRVTLFALLALPVSAYVEALYPLRQVILESEVIAEGVVEKIDPTNRIATCRITKSLKGKCHYEQIRMNLGGGQEWHPEAILKHVVPGQPMLIFYNADRRAEAYVSRFFFQLYGDAAAPAEKAWWNYTHIEIRMNRTFNGTAAELSDVLQKTLAGAVPPAPNEKLPPISKESLRALPAPGEPVADEGLLPPPFLKPGVVRKPDPKIANLTWPVHEEGFLRQWLLLGPIPLGPQASDHSEAAQKGFFDRDWFPNPAAAKPRAHERVDVAGDALSWEPVEAPDWALDFTGTDNALFIAVVYVVADADLADLTLLVGSDDSCRLLLNGVQVHRLYMGRGCQKDQDRIPGIKLNKGVNVLQAWVINGAGGAGVGVRFSDKSGAPVKSIRVSRSPTPDAR